MKVAVVLAALTIAAPTIGYGAIVEPGLEGAWVVDLRLNLDDPPYSKPMRLEITPQGVVRGEFYEHPIESGRAATQKQRSCFSFRTSDRSGPYETSGCLVGGKIEGQTWSEARKFVLPWTAVRP